MIQNRLCKFHIVMLHHKMLVNCNIHLTGNNLTVLKMDTILLQFLKIDCNTHTNSKCEILTRKLFI